MKNHIKATKALLVASLIVVTLLCIVAISSTSGRLSASQEGSANDFIKVRDALRRGGLREAAKVKGHYIGDFDPHWDFGRFDIEALTKNSTAVVVGTVTRKLAERLAENDQIIFTDYEVMINETIKGVPTKGSTITIALPGGRVNFEDGTSAELRTPHFEHVKPGNVYALFLSESESPNGPDEYILTGGPQGLVEIMNDGALKSHGRSTDPIALETKDPRKGKNKSTFLMEIRRQTVKWPGPGRCCS